MLLKQGAWVQSLVRELDPICCNQDLGQPNKFFFFKARQSRSQVKFSYHGKIKV